MMTKQILILAGFAPALLVSACADPAGVTVNRGVESVHQPVVSRTDYVFDVQTANGALAPGEHERLVGWMQSLRLTYGDRVSIDDPAVDARARGEIAADVSRYGLQLSHDAPITSAPVTPGTLRVVISRNSASVPGCPDYSLRMEPNFNNDTSSNYGCGVNSNLAAMVANPADLVRGQPGAETIDQQTSTKAIDAYRKAPTTGAAGLKTESTKESQ
jgi:pilus assembly protein CpaD